MNFFSFSFSHSSRQPAEDLSVSSTVSRDWVASVWDFVEAAAAYVRPLLRLTGRASAAARRSHFPSLRFPLAQLPQAPSSYRNPAMIREEHTMQISAPRPAFLAVIQSGAT